MKYKKLIQENKQEVVDWFLDLDDFHRRKATPYYKRKFFAKRILKIEAGRELDDFDIRWIEKFGVKDFIKIFY